MPYDILQAINFAFFVKAAEAIDSGDNPQYDPPSGYTVLTALFANDLATDISGPTDYVPFGYVARGAGGVVVALRGTDHIFEWIQDARFDMVSDPIPGGAGRTEDGFTSVYSSLRVKPADSGATLVAYLQASLQPGEAVTVCGHSLGASLATLSGYDIALNVKPAQLTVYTYASPNVGNSDFANSYNATAPVTYRIVNPFDIVTHVPPKLLLGYAEVGQTVQYLPGQELVASIPCYHYLQSYMHLMSVAAGQSPAIPADPECTPS